MSLLLRDLTVGNSFYQAGEYDEFIGKWVRKRKKKRANKPRVIARKNRKNNKSIKKRRVLQQVKTTPPPRNVIKKMMKKQTTSKPANPVKAKVIPTDKTSTPIVQTTMIPLTRAEAQVHKNVNKAIQEEHKTKQEELKTKNLENRVAQEAAKTEQIKGQTQVANTSKALLWVVGVLGAIVVVKFVLGDIIAPQAATSK